MSPTMRRMLIVDDERDICDCLEHFFAAHGFTVRSAFSGEEALERLKGDPVDVMLLDILLPGLSGIEILKQVKARYPATTVIMVTGIAETDVRQKALAGGAIGYVTKPFELNETVWMAALKE